MGKSGQIKKLKKKVRKLKKKLASATNHVNDIAPLAPAGFPDLPVIAGARFAAARAGVSTLR